MIDIRNLSKSYGDKAVLCDLSLTVSDGSIYGLVGYNGAGKTTLLSLIAGLLHPDAGSITAEVTDPKCGDVTATEVFDSESVRRELFYIQDEPYILPAASLDTMASFYRGFYPRFSMETYRRLLAVFGLNPKARIAGYSKGMKRQAAIILGLSARPKYLLLDESFDGLDPTVRATVCDLLMEYMADTGATVLMASHNLEAIEHICDTVGILNGNRLVCSGELDEVCAGYIRIKAGFSQTAPAVPAELHCGDLTASERVLSFVTEDDPETVRRALAAAGGLMLFETYPVSLEEVFRYETRKGGGGHDITGLFAD